MKPLKYWNPEGFEISSYRHNLSERINQSYNGSGSDNTDRCTYTYNSLGFRGDEPTKEGFKIMSIGCSITEGIGLNDNETWSHQFTELIPNGVDLNFGTSGRSNDYIVRALLSYYDVIKPDLVLIMYTETHRREFYTKDGGIEPFHHKDWGYFKETSDGILEHKAHLTLLNKNNNFINWYKNHTLIKLFLESKNCNWIWNGWFATNEYSDENRFDGDYFPFKDLGVDGSHPGPIHNKEYALRLHNYISENFPEYLPQLK
jgi:hypothetical protein